jgi:hypothetical protein
MLWTNVVDKAFVALAQAMGSISIMLKGGIEMSVIDDDMTINYGGEKKAKGGGGGHGGAMTTTTTMLTTMLMMKHASGVRRGGSLQLVEEEYHTQQSIRRNIEADTDNNNDDDSDSDSDKDDNVSNGGNDKNKCGHRGGITRAINYGDEMVMMKMMGG